jgi:FkbM family methyltransferase
LDFTNGFFVEAGANDGMNQSNTLYFERHRGWTGLLIEPIPELAARCRVNRPRCLVENCALVPFSFREPAVVMRYCNLMSVVKNSMKTEQEELAHIQAGCEIQRTEPYELTVPACTLTSLLDKHHVQQFDLLSLDVEGFELNALKGLDFARHQPAFMLIEARYRDEIDTFLQSYYKPVAELSEHDVLYQLIRR